MARIDATTALALEALDLLTVLGVPGWRAITVTVDRSQGAPRAGLIESVVDSPREHVDLGVDHEGLRATLDEVLVELCAGGGESLHARRDDDNNAEITVRNAADTEILRRAIGPDLSLYRIYTEGLFDAARDAATVIDEGQAWLADQAQGHDDWKFDGQTRELSLEKGVLPWRRFRAEVLATWATESETLLWAWSNEHLPAQSTQAATRVRDEAVRASGLGALLRASLPCDEPLASALVRIAAARCGARAVYPAAYESGVIYLAILGQLETQPT